MQVGKKGRRNEKADRCQRTEQSEQLKYGREKRWGIGSKPTGKGERWLGREEVSTRQRLRRVYVMLFFSR